jgi:RNA polymerase sigma-70 factor (ECF subfamily)
VTSERTKTHSISGDASEFISLIEPYRRELHLHCYRLLGSLHEAEDLVQETMLRAWQHFDTFKGQAQLGTWLYRIATNACLDALKKRLPRTLPVAVSPAADPLHPLAPAWAESTWLEPYPDSWLAEATERRTRQRAIPDAKVSRSLFSSFFNCSRPANERSCCSAVNSALHRARVTLSKQYHADEQKRGEVLRADAATQALLERYLRAWETEDVDGLVALMKEDATFSHRRLRGIRGERRFVSCSPCRPLHRRHRTDGTSSPQGPMGVRPLPFIALLDRAVPLGPSGFKSSHWRLAHQACSLPM